MNITWYNYCTNLLRLLVGDVWLRPLAVAYTLTTQCNLNCAYCEDFGARRNAQQPAPLPLAEAIRLLDRLRPLCGHLIITGGEPLLYPDLLPLLEHARRRRFRITLLSNAVLLGQRMEVLPYLDRLMVSLDAAAPEVWERTLGGPPGTAHTIRANLAAAAQRQRADRFQLVVNCVVTPETLSQAPAVLEFCAAHGMLFSFSPQSVNNWPRYELLVSAEYHHFVQDLIARKRRGAPILGSMAYLRVMRDFTPYACYPMLIPRLMPEGTLAYPCRPIERAGDAHGGRDLPLLPDGWSALLAAARARYGATPSQCGSCFQQCYVEPSLMQTQPWALLWELLAYRASRRGGVATYAPG